ncbi:MAG: type II toxin-antitoxin system VapC family toxin [Candidatus Latescibacteria bacterium]|jgi:predicted nucleic acid-binding protein|nr:type II toxin-antitoxin system VapC family toxin [Candidatus Latescibacterota bacterium]MBT4139463.1 type II toxin-antitoxin system VapC family toxin [Candidatus Latescibacterota bacterium]MBT5830720.1 type II toxin-antitoxin system VapC family toxin [Candidatus Latescibacterota bacterium]
MILVDTSIWITYLRSGDTRLQNLLINGEVACHPFIIGELACGNLQNRQAFLSLLQDLPQTNTVDQQEILYFIEIHQLMGLGIGFIDIHLLASAKLSRMPLWTSDRRLKAAAQNLSVAFSN